MARAVGGILARIEATKPLRNCGPCGGRLNPGRESGPPATWVLVPVTALGPGTPGYLFVCIPQTTADALGLFLMQTYQPPSETHP